MRDAGSIAGVPPSLMQRKSIHWLASPYAPVRQYDIGGVNDRDGSRADGINGG
jgi:hypothetical protein